MLTRNISEHAVQLDYVNGGVQILIHNL